MPKYFFKAGDRVGDSIVLRGDAAHHLLHVLRLKAGACITLCDGGGLDYAATLREADEKRGTCLFELAAPAPCLTEPPVFVTLYQALPKGDKMEWAIQKCVELGVGKIVPLYTKHTVVHGAEKKIHRYQRVAESAAGQSMRGIVPEITQPLRFNDAVKMKNANEMWLAALAPSEMQCAALNAEDSMPRRIRDIFANASPLPAAIGLWVGPEGGFCTEEIAALLAVGAVPVSLGRRVLRAETAALAALSQIFCLTE